MKTLPYVITALLTLIVFLAIVEATEFFYSSNTLWEGSSLILKVVGRKNG